ncbi:hypothetical protein FS749_013429, partial [Ceratobasidium sp. UAMH 11750]
DGLFTILDSCSNLHELDLTGCRSVPVRDRRRFFEVRLGIYHSEKLLNSIQGLGIRAAENLRAINKME